MKCPNCGERVLRKGKLPGEGLILINRYVLFNKGNVTAACPRCGTHVNIIKAKPTLVKRDK